jgi:hypothetical protein
MEEIREFLKILICWEVVILVIFLVLIKPLKNLLLNVKSIQMEGKIGKVILDTAAAVEVEKIKRELPLDKIENSIEEYAAKLLTDIKEIDDMQAKNLISKIDDLIEKELAMKIDEKNK